MNSPFPHFFEEMANDDFQVVDIENAILHGRIRRRFRRDPRGTRYEIVGPATDGRQIAVICRIKETGKLLFITTYGLSRHRKRCSLMYHYGKCHVCGGKMEPKQIRQDFWMKGRLVVVEKVPAGVCAQCGEKVVTANVGRKLAEILSRRKGLKKKRTMSVPVIRFVEQVA